MQSEFRYSGTHPRHAPEEFQRMGNLSGLSVKKAKQNKNKNKTPWQTVALPVQSCHRPKWRHLHPGSYSMRVKLTGEEKLE